MRYLSVCSGIEAATVAWHPLGWEPAAFSEIERFPRQVLKHHYPEVPLHGDFTTIQGDEYEAIDLLVGGTPCQSFSVAGLRGGLADERGNLALEFLRLAHRTRARWVVWENVPGVLSSNGGRDFGSILGGLVELGYGFAYRVLDAQFCGVPQRRRRVFVVGYLGDWRRAAAVLFERHSLSGHPAPRREAGQDTSGSTGDGLARCLTTGEMKRQDWETCNIVAHTLRGEGFDAGEDGTGRGTPLVPIAFHPTQDPIWSDDGSTHAMGTGSGGGCATIAVAFSCKDYGADATNDISPTLRSMGHADSHANGGGQVAVAFTASAQANSYAWERDVYPTLLAQAPNDSSNIQQGVRQGMAVRRLTPRECERLQGFPDDYTLLGDKTPDGPRYKALGNSMAVPVMRWIGERIAKVSSI
jgi:DNA (cytosine-5)-methyltransferase 1